MPSYDFRTPRLFIGTPLESGGDVSLPAEAAHYLEHVLRLRPGGQVLLFNGRDGEWRATIGRQAKRTVTLALVEQSRPQTGSGNVTLLFAPLKHARLDYMAQKAVEMGVCAIQPVLTERTQVARVNLDRLRANAIEAAEQCGILAIPTIGEPARLAEAVAALPPDCALVFCDEATDERDPLRALAACPAPASVAVLIGPEGGFSPMERVALLARQPAVRLSLGPRILRADTAAVAALALVQAALGDWR